jgi:alpha-L-rhamnosidase
VQVWDKDRKASAWSKAATWKMGLLKDADWKGSWITIGPRQNPDAAPMLRREFIINKPVKQAYIYVCGLGYYELYINGDKIGDNVLDPAQTDYEQRAFYVPYDVTDKLNSSLESRVTGHESRHSIGVILGDGWYNQNKVWTKGEYRVEAKEGPAYGKPRLLLQLEITYADGSIETVVTDKRWKATTGPITANNLYAGESYDARLEHTGWAAINFDDNDWDNAVLIDGPGGKLLSQTLPAIKRMKTIKPIGIANPKPGVYVYDMGQNFAGRARLKIRAKRGERIQLRFAETVFDNGMINPASCGGYATGLVQTDSYICKGDVLEVWEPRFTYHGFRYAEMTGFEGKPSIDNLEGIVVHTAVEQAGHFQCSDAMLNRIHQAALWTELNSLYGMPTDGSARERCGWLGDAHVSAEMSIYNFDVPLLLTKFVADIETARRGGIPYNVAPGRRLGGQDPDWGSAFIQLPWYLYLYYGDTRVAGRHYEGMTIFMNHLKTIAKDYIIHKGIGDLFEPGSVYSKRTPVKLTSTAFFYFDAKLMSRLARVLGKPGDAADYGQLAEDIKSAFNKNFYDADNKTYGSQTADTLALYLELAPAAYHSDVAESLARDVVEKHDTHHATGHIGSRYIYGQLARYGYGHIAQQMLDQTTYPSIGELFKRGATTFWEYWGEKHIDETSRGTRSQNHPFQAGYDAWFYSGVAGINPMSKSPGFKHIVLQPRLIKQLQWAGASYHSMYGLIESKWRNEEDTFQWRITIPPNTTATVYVPAAGVEAITEGGRPAKKAEGVKFLRMEDDRAVFAVGAGRYRFVTKVPKVH